MMDVNRTQSAYRSLPRLVTERPRRLLVAALEALFVPCLCFGIAAGAFAGTYYWLLHR